MDCVKLLLPLSISIINQKVRGTLLLTSQIPDDRRLQNNVGDTPLHVASWKNHPEIVQLLLENGADKRIRNQDNKIAFDLTHDPAVRSLLEDKGRQTIFLLDL